MTNRLAAAIALLMAVFTFSFAFTSFAFTGPAAAQQGDAWIQIEANPTLRAAQDGVRIRAASHPKVGGFRLRNGWYAVALGPYASTGEARAEMARLKAAGEIPEDAFIAHSSDYAEQFWPVGAALIGASGAPVVIGEPDPSADEGPVAVANTGADGAPLVDESPAEARASERRLTPEQRQALQVALRKGGYYTGAIDGDFGPGTRGSMAAWQEAHGLPATGILTTAQREMALIEAGMLKPGQDIGQIDPSFLPDEPPAQARASERALSREQRMALQEALQWAGFYDSAIDGAIGPGTRRSMAAWQAARGHEATGVLTTRQRAELLGEVQTAMASLGLAVMRDEGAGIEIALPLSLVTFDRYEAPFAHYGSLGDSGVRVVLISQAGDQNTLFGLYDIMQSLKIVPLEGARERKAREFTISGQDDEITSYTYAALADGAVKGFTLIWPNGGDLRLREMALAQMRATFKPIPGVVLADNAGLDQATQSIDLMSGLEIRRPTVARSGFYVSENGAVLTTTEAVRACGRITLDELYDARLTATDPASGLALLHPEAPLAPMGAAALRAGEARLGATVAVAGFPYEGALSAPTLTFGTLADIRGLEGEQGIARLELAAEPGNAGGPVLAPDGTVIGMLAPRADDKGRLLPENASFAVKSALAASFLERNGIAPRLSQGGAALDPVDLSALARDMTVLVSCWN